ncbi:P-loop domain-containing protein [Nocardia bovistercoris]|uniref:Nephrocystin 3-like N-terminal domain-containing protein n=1 Tax=Nocardia bovistercoris TaxID=2785916 RepID=A0A931IGA1_9NOCA|nr:hypothetical protein [Nocardia bovistercoris]MBH0779820.1 hypothetical protein [Nocardia bovistercoris]
MASGRVLARAAVPTAVTAVISTGPAAAVNYVTNGDFSLWIWASVAVLIIGVFAVAWWTRSLRSAAAGGGRARGILLRKVEARGGLLVHGIHSSGTAVEVDGGRFGGNIEVDGITAGDAAHPPVSGTSGSAASIYDFERVTVGGDLRITHHLHVGVVPSGGFHDGRSHYISQVREFLAPVNGLLDREHELGELTDFCRGEQPYLWIEAEPWAGKTALLSWFTLSPPSKVTVIGFFVTDRLADQNTHTAFTAAVLGQLAVLLPDHHASIAAATIDRDGLRAELLTLAARREAAAGRRLVLVVDGLDEDTGTPPIVTLLPSRPDPNLRVIVSSRHGPPLPIPHGHPLADTAPHPLAASPFAADIRAKALAELRALLRGPVEHRDLLALITAANGLTASELADLTGTAPFRIHELLHVVAGRSLRTLSAYSGPDEGDPVYALAHETLQRTAESELGVAYIGTCLEEFHAWADRYRNLAWPDRTPDFLLRRYFTVLDKHDDLPRMTAAAVDAARHDRMRAHTGGDAIALDEIRTVQHHIREQPDPDLFATARLARHRDDLHNRNEYIPTELLTLFARLGRLDRAEALAYGIRDPERQAKAFAHLAEEVRDTDPASAVRLADRTETLMDRYMRPEVEIEVLVCLAAVLMTTNTERALEFVERAVTLVPKVSLPGRRADVFDQLVAVVARANPDRGEVIAERTDPRQWRARAYVELCAAVVSADPERAMDLADRAEALVGNLYDWKARYGVLPRLAAVIARTDPERAGRLVEETESHLGSLRDPSDLVEMLTQLVDATVESDRDRAVRYSDRAEILARALSVWWQRSTAFARLAVAVAGFDIDRAEALTAEVLSPAQRADTLARLAVAMVGTDTNRAVRLADHAEKLTRESRPAALAAESLIALARTVVGTNAPLARRLIDRADPCTDAILDSRPRINALARTAAILAGMDVERAHRVLDRAEVVADDIPDPADRCAALNFLARHAIDVDPDRAERIIDRAAKVSERIREPDKRAFAFADVASAMARVNPNRAESLIQDLPGLYRSEALAHRAMSLWPSDSDRAAGLIDRAEADLRSGVHRIEYPNAVARVVPVLANFDPARAEALVASIFIPEDRTPALANLAVALSARDPDRAEILADSIVEGFVHSNARASAFTNLAAAVAPLDRDRAARLSVRAEALILDRATSYHQPEDLLRLAVVVAGIEPERAIGLVDRAAALARDMRSQLLQAHVFTDLAAVAAVLESGADESIEQGIVSRRSTAPSDGAEGSRSRRFLARAWSLDRWDVPLKVLPLIDAPLLHELVTELLDE